jgi:hypothetical protein
MSKQMIAPQMNGEDNPRPQQWMYTQTQPAVEAGLGLEQSVQPSATRSRQSTSLKHAETLLGRITIITIIITTWCHGAVMTHPKLLQPARRSPRHDATGPAAAST